MDTVHYFIGKVPSVEEQARLNEELAKLEHAAAQLEALVKRQPHDIESDSNSIP